VIFILQYYLIDKFIQITLLLRHAAIHLYNVIISRYHVAMRTIIDLPNEQLKHLAELCEREGISRAEAIRRAVDKMLAEAQKPSMDEALKAVFGMWKDREEMQDSVEYQRRLRAEWDREWDEK
jgi:metal-responsive CopG/Arc/MetJ family transcriptional regulator